MVTSSSVHRAIKANAHAEHRCQLTKLSAGVGIDGCGFDGQDFHVSCRVDTGRVQLGHPFPPRWTDFEPSCRVTVRMSGCRDPIAESIHHPAWGDSCTIPKRNLGHLQLSYVSTPRKDVWDHYKDRAAPLELARLAELIESSKTIQFQQSLPKKRSA